MKREAFKHEKEVRLLFQDMDPKRGAAGVALLDLEINTVCEEIVLDPRLSNSDAAVIEGEIKAAGCILPISQSALYRVPSFKIRLC